ncbi:uncharacterized protein LOC110820240 [Carica papaya]|uniref:uncharacterized protein LOC110820240 n=1 Tax=Carica papaya TaxID=3649 RepID=UPI000B8C8D23|nr:uncharacterized protein LOC110820240 [Carica papaya]
MESKGLELSLTLNSTYFPKTVDDLVKVLKNIESDNDKAPILLDYLLDHEKDVNNVKKAIQGQLPHCVQLLQNVIHDMFSKKKIALQEFILPPNMFGHLDQKPIISKKSTKEENDSIAAHSAELFYEFIIDDNDDDKKGKVLINSTNPVQQYKGNDKKRPFMTFNTVPSAFNWENEDNEEVIPEVPELKLFLGKQDFNPHIPELRLSLNKQASSIPIMEVGHEKQVTWSHMLEKRHGKQVVKLEVPATDYSKQVLGAQQRDAKVPKIEPFAFRGLNLKSDFETLNHFPMPLTQPILKNKRRSWSSELHGRFVQALDLLGGDEVATPKQIKEIMQVEGLTSEQVKSHLQRYRLRQDYIRQYCHQDVIQSNFPDDDDDDNNDVNQNVAKAFKENKMMDTFSPSCECGSKRGF